MHLRRRCQCLAHIALKMVFNKCDARAPLRIVEMASTAGSEASGDAADLVLVVTRKHGQPHEVNANVRASTRLDDFRLHRTSPESHSPADQILFGLFGSYHLSTDECCFSHRSAAS